MKARMIIVLPFFSVAFWDVVVVLCVVLMHSAWSMVGTPVPPLLVLRGLVFHEVGGPPGGYGPPWGV